MLTFQLDTSEDCFVFMDALNLIRRATNINDNKTLVLHPSSTIFAEYSEEEIDLNVSGDMHGAFGGHGGGDARLVRDFVRVVRGEPRSLSTTDLEDSITGHLIGFCADRAMAEQRVVQCAWQ